jgi:hypothetical protein
MTPNWTLGALLAERSPWSYPWSPTWGGSYGIAVAIGIVCIVIVAVCYLVELRGVTFTRRLLLTMLRSTAILLLGWMLLGWSWTPYAEEPADLVVLVDSSQSMLTEDAGKAPAMRATKAMSRIERTKSLLLQEELGLLDRAAERYRPRVAHFGDDSAWLSLETSRQRRELQELAANGDATRLGDAIQDALRLQRGRSAAAIVVLSDGIRTSGLSLESAAAEAKAAGTPIYVIGLGEDARPRDVRISNLIYSPRVFLGDVVYIEADLEAEGFSEMSLRVQLKDARGGESLATESVTIRAGRLSHVRIPIRPAELGEWKFLLEVERPEGDLNPQNNAASGAMMVQEETVRVLLVDRRPRYDYRYLVDLLSRVRKRGIKTEPAFEVRTFLQEGDSGLAKQDSAALDAFPTAEELAQYDVIVLGDIDVALLGTAAHRNVIEAATRGGVGLILLPSTTEGVRRWEDSPLEFLLPARAGEISPLTDMEMSRSGAVTALGRQTPFCLLGERVSQSESAWRTLPPIHALLSTPRLRPDVRVLVEVPEVRMEDGRPAPLATMHYVGAAKVLCHWTDEWWRWAAPSTRGSYDQYWMQAVRFVCSQKLPPGDEQFELTCDAARYEEGQRIRLTLHFRDERLAPRDDLGAVISLRAGDTTREVVLTPEEERLDLFRGSIGDLPPGSYEATVVRPPLVAPVEKTCRFEVSASASESARLRPDFEALRALANQSGGQFYTEVKARELVEDLPRGDAVRTLPLAPKSAWNLPVWAALMVGLLSLEWFLRRAGGLL